MSNFLTKIPISVDETKKLLPKDASIEKIHFNPNTSEVEVTWHHPRLHTGFTFPATFTLDQLKSKELPEGVRELPPFMPKPKAPQPETPLPKGDFARSPAARKGKAPKTPKAPKQKPAPAQPAA